MIVVDASVLACALLDDDGDGERARRALLGEDLAAPHLVDGEVASIIRRARLRDEVTERRAEQALADLAELPILRFPHNPLLARIWQLHAGLTPYDAAYVAVAEALAVPLLTADQDLVTAPGLHCPVSLLY